MSGCPLDKPTRVETTSAANSRLLGAPFSSQTLLSRLGTADMRFKIVAVDYLGKNRTSGGDQFFVYFNGPAVGAADVLDNRDGAPSYDNIRISSS